MRGTCGITVTGEGRAVELARAAAAGTEVHRPADPLEAEIALADGGVDAVELFLDRGAGAGLVPALAAGGGDGELAGLVDAVQHVAAGTLGHALFARAEQPAKGAASRAADEGAQRPAEQEARRGTDGPADRATRGVAARDAGQHAAAHGAEAGDTERRAQARPHASGGQG